MSEKKKVLIINDYLQYGGSDLVAFRLQHNLDKEKFECVYCLRRNMEGPFEPQVAKTGVRIIHQPDKELGYIKGYRYLNRLFKNEHFDIVHCHLLFFSGVAFMAAKRNGVKKRVAHSHFSQPLIYGKSKIKKIVGEIYRKFMRIILRSTATDVIGCSREAGEYLVGKKFFDKKGIVLNNGIETDVYMLDNTVRALKRKELGVENKIVLGHIGQMYYVKNQEFLIDVFNEFQTRNPDSVLLLISDGPDREKLENKVAKLGLTDKVQFLGFRDDIPQLMMAMDCFVFPSVHEGFPLTLVEAQAAKLPCVVSDTITPDVKLSNALSFLSIRKEPSLWFSEIEKMLSLERNNIDNHKVIEQFEIKNICKKLEKIYLS